MFMKKFKALVAVAAVSVGLAGSTIVTSAPEAHAATCKQSQWRRGHKGTCVKYIQRMINGIDREYAGVYNNGVAMSGSQLAVDGSFGPNTQGKIKPFQAWTGVRRDGIVGPDTWGLLCIYAKQGAFRNSPYAVERGAYAAGLAAGCTNED